MYLHFKARRGEILKFEIFISDHGNFPYNKRHQWQNTAQMAPINPIRIQPYVACSDCLAGCDVYHFYFSKTYFVILYWRTCVGSTYGSFAGYPISTACGGDTPDSRTAAIKSVSQAMYVYMYAPYTYKCY
jgi:hypothetical protein